MRTDAISLRRLIGKWMGPAAGLPVRITRVARSPVNPYGCVRVEAAHGDSRLALFFFRHGDGCWYVFPPQRA
ncbi:hypothetical protein BKK79_33985 [Cupriavidus sp. USMAA2-4]|uniref:hypothetical protein n=1 Tax=Cupriavidus sp. USMAA2-4 TaxID=876364 RepID=UPI0008A67E73|nr:hypothetical protein [Cupriavidus sp. USMAA2-4]AOY96551.1 hypothetical protein BKK79_33985 [Cupriavidus sp. USMAA2-4]